MPVEVVSVAQIASATQTMIFKEWSFKTMRVSRCTLAQLAIRRPTLSSRSAKEGVRAVAQHLFPSSLAIDVYMNLPALFLNMAS